MPRIVAAELILNRRAQTAPDMPTATVRQDPGSLPPIAGAKQMVGGLALSAHRRTRPVALAPSGPMAGTGRLAHAPECASPAPSGGDAVMPFRFPRLSIAAAGPGASSPDRHRL